MTSTGSGHFGLLVDNTKINSTGTNGRVLTEYHRYRG